MEHPFLIGASTAALQEEGSPLCVTMFGPGGNRQLGAS
jgi:hypothetical protein